MGAGLRVDKGVPALRNSGNRNEDTEWNVCGYPDITAWNWTKTRGKPARPILGGTNVNGAPKYTCKADWEKHIIVFSPRLFLNVSRRNAVMISKCQLARATWGMSDSQHTSLICLLQERGVWSLAGPWFGWVRYASLGPGKNCKGTRQGRQNPSTNKSLPGGPSYWIHVILRSSPRVRLTLT